MMKYKGEQFLQTHVVIHHTKDSSKPFLAMHISVISLVCMPCTICITHHH